MLVVSRQNFHAMAYCPAITDQIFDTYVAMYADLPRKEEMISNFFFFFYNLIPKVRWIDKKRKKSCSFHKITLKMNY